MTKILWFTGLSGSGKTTIANMLKAKLEEKGKTVAILDGDIVRETHNRHLGFTREDIRENNKIISELAIKEDADYILIPIISPYQEDRTAARKLIGDNFVEVYVNASVEECSRRDVKGLYYKARVGEINNLIGVADTNPYQRPIDPELELKTKEESVEESVNKILEFLNIPELSEDTRLAIKAAKVAGKAILKIYQEEDYIINLKDDKSPITKADLQSNKIITQYLTTTNHVILSEESKDSLERLEQSKVWIIDPLDGTSDFINKTGEFTVMIALVENNLPTIGIVYQPTTDILYVAEKGKGCYKVQGKKWNKLTVNQKEDFSKSNAVVSRHHLSDKERIFLEQLSIGNYSQVGSSGLKIAKICEQTADIYFTTTDQIKQWDTCAAYCLIKEAGGEITDIFGNKIIYNQEKINHKNGILATNKPLQKLMLKRLQDFAN